MSTIVDRGYVEKKEARFWPTELSILVNGLLVERFPGIVSSDFTAKMESSLDHVEDGTEDWRALLGDFYTPFKLDPRKGARPRCATSSARRSRPRLRVREVRQADGREMGPEWPLPRMPALSGVSQHQGSRQEPRRHVGARSRADHRRGVRDPARRADDGQAWPVPDHSSACTTLSGLQDDEADEESPSGSSALVRAAVVTSQEKRSRRGKPFYGCSNMAGSEAAWQLAEAGFRVALVDMKPAAMSPAHQTPLLGELVCSNSLRSDDPVAPAGPQARAARVRPARGSRAPMRTRPAGQALAVATWPRARDHAAPRAPPEHPHGAASRSCRRRRSSSRPIR